MVFENLNQQQLREIRKVLHDLLENIMEQLQDREKYHHFAEEMVIFPPQLKKKFLEKIAELRVISPDFEEYLFQSPFDTELPLKRSLLTGIEQGLALTKWHPYQEYGKQMIDEEGKVIRKMFLPYKAIQVIYECFARILIEVDAHIERMENES